MTTIFAAAQLGNPLGKPSNLPMQGELRLLGRIDGPSVVHPEVIANLESYREAVRMCFALRRVKGMNRKTVAELAGIHTPHISEFLADEGSREMPAKYVPAFEQACGNCCITQWMARQARLTVLEEVQAARAA